MKRTAAYLLTLLLILLLASCSSYAAGAGGAPAAGAMDNNHAPFRLQREEIATLQVRGGQPGSGMVTPLYWSDGPAGSRLIGEIVNWLNHAEPAAGPVDAVAANGYPSYISIGKRDGTQIAVEPAYDCQAQAGAPESGNAEKVCTPAVNEIVMVMQNGEKIRLASPELVSWLDGVLLAAGGGSPLEAGSRMMT